MVDQDRRRCLAACSSACCSGCSRGVRAGQHDAPVRPARRTAPKSRHHARLRRRPAGRDPHARRHAAQPHAAAVKAGNASRWCCRCRICRPTSRTLPISASSWAATATASAAPASSSMARRYTLTANNGPNTLHGGDVGFGKYVWSVLGTGGGRNSCDQAGPSLAGRHQRLSGQPRRHRADQRLRGHADPGVRGDHRRGDADQPHLASRTSTSPAIRAAASTNRLLTMNASHYLPINDSRVPTGEIAPVAGTPFDFRRPRNLRVPPPSSHPQIALAGGLRSLLGARQAARAASIAAAAHAGARAGAAISAEPSGVRMSQNSRTNLPGICTVYGALSRVEDRSLLRGWHCRLPRKPENLPRVDAPTTDRRISRSSILRARRQTQPTPS